MTNSKKTRQAGSSIETGTEKERRNSVNFEPYVYIATKIITSTIHARRVKLMTRKWCVKTHQHSSYSEQPTPQKDKQGDTPTRPVVPPTVDPCQTSPAICQETLPAVT